MVLFCKPRVCGEKKVWYGVEDIASGSPPRMRGKAQAEQVRRFLKSMSTEDVGSPPRMRGKESLHTPTCRNTGITPAYAGKRKQHQISVRMNEDHPRVCGEKHKIFSSRSNPLGSPPRMRGKVCCACSMVYVAGITPAYAGKSAAADRHRQQHRDHPRVCGEKLVMG